MMSKGDTDTHGNYQNLSDALGVVYLLSTSVGGDKRLDQ